MDREKTYTIGQLAKLAGVTTKTLRHYERINLLVPQARTDAGYRLYNDADGRKLAEILAYRALNMPLDQIAQLLNTGTTASTATGAIAPPTTRSERLAAHLSKMQTERKKLDHLISHLEEMLLNEEEGTPMNTQDELNGFANNPYEEEAKGQWGHTDAYKESAKRVKNYTPADWERYKKEAADINDRFVALMQAGTAADSKQAQELAEEHRQLISTWFYDCTPQMHAGFGDMWEADPRFKQNIDKAAEGLSEYMAQAFKAAVNSN